MNARLASLAAYAEELERWQRDHDQARAVYVCEDAYRFLAATLEALLEADEVLSARGLAPGDEAEQRAQLRCEATLLAATFSALEVLCRALDVGAYEPQVIDLAELKRKASQARNLLPWLEGAVERPDPEAHRRVESELGAAWEPRASRGT